MTRLELLTLAVNRARAHGFEFRRWYTHRLNLPWINADAALALLEQQRRYYALLFSHEFAQAFWKAGEEITFEIPAVTYQRTLPDGSIGMVRRKAFMRRSSRRDAWRFHLREMALAEDPLRHLLRYFRAGREVVLEEKTPATARGASQKAFKGHALAPQGARSTGKRQPKPLPDEPPAFLQRRSNTPRPRAGG